MDAEKMKGAGAGSGGRDGGYAQATRRGRLFHEGKKWFMANGACNLVEKEDRWLRLAACRFLWPQATKLEH
ncbi:hypothetical protein KSP40_PGU001029 [Platanthera guangdongensis]|uniref:Uncharacterized protein n=1 Tax=Platanthera guangdongensis TaxID=2320717 RepID=A0ABR2LKR2_9ASPA